jgi:putative ABC transport system substrate-binding protein
MRRIGLAVVLTVGLFLPLLAVEAQQAAKIPRIGYLANRLAANPDQQEAFLQGLRDLGYVDGRDVVIEYRDAEGKLERLSALAAQLVALKVDVIVAAAGTLPALAAQQASRTVPIVFIAVGNPVTSGLVTSLARPGGNLTGLSALTPELASKWLELLKQAVPGVTRVAVLWQPGGMGDTDKEVLKQADVAARVLAVRVHVVEARSPTDIDRAFSDLIRARANGLAVLSTPMFADERRRLVDLAARSRLPAVYSFKNYVDAGGLMSYGPNVADLSRRAAAYVDKILKGAKPADLPIEQPTKFELVINLKTAKALGLAIPQSILIRADELIQ